MLVQRAHKARMREVEASARAATLVQTYVRALQARRAATKYRRYKAVVKCQSSARRLLAYLAAVRRGREKAEASRTAITNAAIASAAAVAAMISEVGTRVLAVDAMDVAARAEEAVLAASQSVGASAEAGEAEDSAAEELAAERAEKLEEEAAELAREAAAILAKVQNESRLSNVAADEARQAGKTAAGAAEWRTSAYSEVAAAEAAESCAKAVASAESASRAAEKATNALTEAAEATAAGKAAVVAAQATLLAVTAIQQATSHSADAHEVARHAVLSVGKSSANVFATTERSTTVKMLERGGSVVLAARRKAEATADEERRKEKEAEAKAKLKGARKADRGTWLLLHQRVGLDGKVSPIIETIPIWKKARMRPGSGRPMSGHGGGRPRSGRPGSGRPGTANSSVSTATSAATAAEALLDDDETEAQAAEAAREKLDAMAANAAEARVDADKAREQVGDATRQAKLVRKKSVAALEAAQKASDAASAASAAAFESAGEAAETAVKEAAHAAAVATAAGEAAQQAATKAERASIEAAVAAEAAEAAADGAKAEAEATETLSAAEIAAGKVGRVVAASIEHVNSAVAALVATTAAASAMDLDLAELSASRARDSADSAKAAAEAATLSTEAVRSAAMSAAAASEAAAKAEAIADGSMARTPPQPPGFVPMDSQALHVFALLDADGSGELSLDELRKGVRRIASDGGKAMMEAIDLDGDGTIDKAEWVGHFNRTAIEQGRERASALLSKLEEAAKAIAEVSVEVSESGRVSLSLFASLPGEALPEPIPLGDDLPPAEAPAEGAVHDGKTDASEKAVGEARAAAAAAKEAASLAASALEDSEVARDEAQEAAKVAEAIIRAADAAVLGVQMAVAAREAKELGAASALLAAEKEAATLTALKLVMDETVKKPKFQKEADDMARNSQIASDEAQAQLKEAEAANAAARKRSEAAKKGAISVEASAHTLAAEAQGMRSGDFSRLLPQPVSDGAADGLDGARAAIAALAAAAAAHADESKGSFREAAEYVKKATEAASMAKEYAGNLAVAALKRKHGDVAMMASIRMQLAIRRFRIRKAEEAERRRRERAATVIQSFVRWRRAHKYFKMCVAKATYLQACARRQLAILERKRLWARRVEMIVRIQSMWRAVCVMRQWQRKIAEIRADRMRRQMIGALWEGAVINCLEAAKKNRLRREARERMAKAKQSALAMVTMKAKAEESGILRAMANLSDMQAKRAELESRAAAASEAASEAANAAAESSSAAAASAEQAAVSAGVLEAEVQAEEAAAAAQAAEEASNEASKFGEEANVQGARAKAEEEVAVLNQAIKEAEEAQAREDKLKTARKAVEAAEAATKLTEEATLAAEAARDQALSFAETAKARAVEAGRAESMSEAITDMASILDMVVVVTGAKEAASKAHEKAAAESASAEEVRASTELSYNHAFAKHVDEGSAEIAKAEYDKCAAAAAEALAQAEVAANAHVAVLEAADTGDLSLMRAFAMADGVEVTSKANVEPHVAQQLAAQSMVAADLAAEERAKTEMAQTIVAAEEVRLIAEEEERLVVARANMEEAGRQARAASRAAFKAREAAEDAEGAAKVEILSEFAAEAAARARKAADEASLLASRSARLAWKAAVSLVIAQRIVGRDGPREGTLRAAALALACKEQMSTCRRARFAAEADAAMADAKEIQAECAASISRTIEGVCKIIADEERQAKRKAARKGLKRMNKSVLFQNQMDKTARDAEASRVRESEIVGESSERAYELMEECIRLKEREDRVAADAEAAMRLAHKSADEAEEYQRRSTISKNLGQGHQAKGEESCARAAVATGKAKSAAKAGKAAKAGRLTKIAADLTIEYNAAVAKRDEQRITSKRRQCAEEAAQLLAKVEEAKALEVDARAKAHKAHEDAKLHLATAQKENPVAQRDDAAEAARSAKDEADTADAHLATARAQVELVQMLIATEPPLQTVADTLSASLAASLAPALASSERAEAESVVARQAAIDAQLAADAAQLALETSEAKIVEAVAAEVEALAARDAADKAEREALAKVEAELEAKRKAEELAEENRIRAAEQARANALAAKERAKEAAEKAKREAEKAQAARQAERDARAEAKRKEQEAKEAEAIKRREEKEKGIVKKAKLGDKKRPPNFASAPNMNTRSSGLKRELDRMLPKSSMTQVDRAHLDALRAQFGLGAPVRLHSPRMRYLMFDHTSSRDVFRPGAVGTLGSSASHAVLNGGDRTGRAQEYVTPGQQGQQTFSPREVMMPQSPDVAVRMRQARRRLKDPDLSRLLGTARANPAHRRPSPKRILPAIERAANEVGMGSRSPTGLRDSAGADFREFYTPSLQLPEDGLPGISPHGMHTAAKTPAAVAAKRALAANPASSGYRRHVGGVRALPGMGAPPAPLRLMTSQSVDSLRSQVEALRAASEVSDRQAAAIRNAWVGGSQHPEIGQNLLKEQHDMAVGRGEYIEARLKADREYVYRDQKLMQADRAKERARKITLEMLANHSRDPVLPGSSSVPNLRTAPAGAKRRNPAAAAVQRERADKLAGGSTHNLLRSRQPPAQPARAWDEKEVDADGGFLNGAESGEPAGGGNVGQASDVWVQ